MKGAFKAVTACAVYFFCRLGVQPFFEFVNSIALFCRLGVQTFLGFANLTPERPDGDLLCLY